MVNVSFLCSDAEFNASKVKINVIYLDNEPIVIEII